MTKAELNEAYHQLAGEAMKVQQRLEKQRQHREVFHMIMAVDWRQAHDSPECEDME